MLCITVAQDGSGDFASISEAVLAVPYDCPAQIRIGAGIYREKLVCEKKDIALQGAGADCTRLVWGDGGKLPHTIFVLSAPTPRRVMQRFSQTSFSR